MYVCRRCHVFCIYHISDQEWHFCYPLWITMKNSHMLGRLRYHRIVRRLNHDLLKKFLPLPCHFCCANISSPDNSITFPAVWKSFDFPVVSHWSPLVPYVCGQWYASLPLTSNFFRRPRDKLGFPNGLGSTNLASIEWLITAMSNVG